MADTATITPPTDREINNAIKKWELTDDERTPIENCVRAWRGWHEARWQEYKFTALEQRAYHTECDVGGTWDAEGVDYDGKRFILDWKTSAAPYDEYIIQTAAYAMMAEEAGGAPVERIGVVRLDKRSGDWSEHWATDEAMAAGREIYRALAMIHDKRRVLKWRK
jgi:hypothetical protein